MSAHLTGQAESVRVPPSDDDLVALQFYFFELRHGAGGGYVDDMRLARLRAELKVLLHRLQMRNVERLFILTGEIAH